jgi:hypothetical protein
MPHSTSVSRRDGPCCRVSLSFAFALFLAALALLAHAAAIRGAISNQSTAKNLEGVTVKVAETGQQVLTESGGLYEITGLAPGTWLTSVATTKVRGVRWQLDFTGRYQVTRNVTVFADLVNLTENHGLKYRGFVEDRFRNETNALGFLMTAGILATF